MAIVIDENLIPLSLRDGESIFIDLTMKVTDDNPTGVIPTDWVGAYEITEFQKETNIILSGAVAQSSDNLKFEVRVPFTDTDALFGKFVISVKASDAATGFGQYIYENIVNIT